MIVKINKQKIKDLENKYPDLLEAIEKYGLYKEIELSNLIDIITNDIIFFLSDEDELYNLASSYYYEDKITSMIKYHNVIKEIENKIIIDILECLD